MDASDQIDLQPDDFPAVAPVRGGQAPRAYRAPQVFVPYTGLRRSPGSGKAVLATGTPRGHLLSDDPGGLGRPQLLDRRLPQLAHPGGR